MQIENLTPQHKLWENAWNLYINSFPDYERREIVSHTSACDDPQFHTIIATEDDKLLALLFYWQDGNMIYIEHLAVNIEMRGQNIGSRIIKQFLDEHPNTICILEIDPPVDDVAIRRLRFYSHLGFLLNDYPYRHPSYKKNGLGHELKILSYPHTINQSEFDRFYALVQDKVLKYIER